MGFAAVLFSKRLQIRQKGTYIGLRAKLFLKRHMNIHLALSERERFVLFCCNFLFSQNGYLLSENKESFLTRFHFTGIAPFKLNIRKEPSSDLMVFEQVFVEREYQKLVDLVLSYCAPGDVQYVMDAGSNAGFTTIYLKRCFPNAAVLSIEPEESNFSQLVKNVSVNQMAPVETLQAGLWKCECKLAISSDFRDNNHWAFQLTESNRPDAIQGYSVKKLMMKQGWPRIDLLKIDIEGAERYLFESTETAGDFLPFVKFIAMEIHDEYNIRDMIHARLKDHNFYFFEASETTFGVNLNFFPETTDLSLRKAALRS